MYIAGRLDSRRFNIEPLGIVEGQRTSQNSGSVRHVSDCQCRLSGRECIIHALVPAMTVEDRRRRFPPAYDDVGALLRLQTRSKRYAKNRSVQRVQLRGWFDVGWSDSASVEV